MRSFNALEPLRNNRGQSVCITSIEDVMSAGFRCLRVEGCCLHQRASTPYRTHFGYITVEGSLGMSMQYSKCSRGEAKRSLIRTSTFHYLLFLYHRALETAGYVPRTWR